MPTDLRRHSAFSQEKALFDRPHREALVHRHPAPPRLPHPLSTTRLPNGHYRTPGVLEPIELLDLLELTGTTSAAAEALGLSQPTVSRRSRRLVQDLSLKSRKPMALQALRYSETSCLRLLRRASQHHRLDAGSWRVGGSPWQQQLLPPKRASGDPPTRFRHPRAWQELLRAHCLDGALLHGLDLRELLPAAPDGSAFEVGGRSALEWDDCLLMPIGFTALGLLLPPGEADAAQPWREVLVPAQQDAPGLASWVRQQQCRSLYAPRQCHRQEDWAALLQGRQKPLLCSVDWAERMRPLLIGWAWQPWGRGAVDQTWLMVLNRVWEQHPQMEPLAEQLVAMAAGFDATAD